MAQRPGQRLAGLRVPDPGGPVARGGDHARAVGAELGGEDLPLMAQRLGQRLAGLASQTRAVLSAEAVTTRVPSGLNWAELTPFSWRRGWVRGSGQFRRSNRLSSTPCPGKFVASVLKVRASKGRLSAPPAPRRAYPMPPGNRRRPGRAAPPVFIVCHKSL